MFKNQDYNSIKVLLFIAIVAVAGYFITSHTFENRTGDTLGLVFPPTIPISSCTTISTPGLYSLTQDIVSTTNTCLMITNTNHVSFDCNGHTVQGLPSTYVGGVSNATITSCVFSAFQGGVAIESSQNINFSNNTFNPEGLNYYDILVNDSSGVKFVQNTINADYHQNFSSGTILKNNTFKVPLPAVWHWPSALISFVYGSSNEASGNSIDGSSPSNNGDGADDGIFIADESNDKIINNKIRNIWDCGIETEGMVENSTFANNQINNAGICGIGGWYWNSLRNDIFSNNTTNDSNLLFDFSRAYGLRPARDEIGHMVPADTALYFNNNQFKGNVFLHPRNTGTTDNYSSRFNFYPISEYAINAGEQPIDSSNMILDSNTFKNNNFGNGSAPLIWPASLGTDQGGNHCGQILSLDPYIYQSGEYPLTCL